MTTKYILHGGSAQKDNHDNNKFFQEILKGVPINARVLLVHFAVLDENREENRLRDVSQFERNQGSTNLSFEVAQKDTFINQVSHADIIYFGGGVSSTILIEKLFDYSNLKELFKGKVIAGESAGANCLASYGYSPSAGKVVKGLGIIPVFVIPHYQVDDETHIIDVPSGFEQVRLPAYQYKVFIQ